MQKFLFFVLILTFFPVFLWGQEALPEKVLPTYHVQIFVKGMVCSFCARGLEKKIKEQKSVASIKIRMKEKLVELVFKPNLTLSDKTLRKIVEDAGLRVDKIVRPKDMPTTNTPKIQEKQQDRALTP